MIVTLIPARQGPVNPRIIPDRLEQSDRSDPPVPAQPLTRSRSALRRPSFEDGNGFRYGIATCSGPTLMRRSTAKCQQMRQMLGHQARTSRRPASRPRLPGGIDAQARQWLVCAMRARACFEKSEASPLRCRCLGRSEAEGTYPASCGDEENTMDNGVRRKAPPPVGNRGAAMTARDMACVGGLRGS